MRYWRPRIAAVFAGIGMTALVFGVARAGAANDAPRPIDLPTALRLAGAQNLDIQIARERLKEAEGNRTSAVEQFFPWLSPGVGYHRRDGLAQAVPAGTVSDANFQSYSPGATMGAQVDLGNTLFQSLAAKENVRASNHRLDAQREDSVLAAAQGYFDLAKTRSLAEVAAQALETSEDYRRQLHDAVAIGIAFKGDELRAQTQKERYRVALRQAREQQRLASATLATVLRLDSQVELSPAEEGLLPITLIETGTPVRELSRRALDSRPELKQSRALMAAAREARKGAVYGPLIPTIGAQAYGGGFGGGSDTGQGNFGVMGDVYVGLGWRIGPGGMFDFGRVKSAQARLSEAELGDEKLRDEITREVVAGLARVQSLADQIEMAKAGLAAAAETLRLTRERKQYGVGVVLEDLQAQQDLAKTRADYFVSIAEYNKAQYALGKAVGGVTLAPPRGGRKTPQ
jgi:outer membrane protein TolC